MPRLAKLLAAGAFVVSEGACGVEHQCATYAEGVVFTDDLVADFTILSGAARGTVARRRAREGSF